VPQEIFGHSGKSHNNLEDSRKDYSETPVSAGNPGVPKCYVETLISGGSACFLEPAKKNE
jgi:hypothetical protein